MQTPVDLAATATVLRQSIDSYLSDLAALVNIESGTYDKRGNERVRGLLNERYRRLGAEITLYPAESTGDISVARFTGDGRVNLLLLGHTDTVYPAGTVAERPFRVDGDRAYGPGSADMKAGDLAIGYALETLLARGWRQFGTIEILHNADEEVGSPESRDLIETRAARADAVLVLEAGRENGDIVSARKGIVEYELRVTGTAAHAGVNHDRGRSAALELAHLIVDLESLNGTIRGVTLNFGMIDVPGRINVVPDAAIARLEVRAPDRERMNEIMRLVEERVARRTVDGTRAVLESRIAHFPMHRSAASERLVSLARSVAHELGFDLHDTATGGASDGNTAAAIGRPVLDGLGPIGGGAHSPKEYVLIPSIAPRVALLAGLMAAICAAR